jgi:aryl-alcohol dehydrogenase-like predicted oxidoreductase
MISRRAWLRTSLGAGATLALTPELLRAIQTFQQSGGKLIQRAIPSSGEMLPVIGLTFANHAACADAAALKDVLKTFVDNGGRVFDMMHHGAPQAETVATAIVNEFGIQNKLFLSWRGHAPGGPPQPGADVLRARIESVLAMLNVGRIDMVMVNPAVDPAHLGVLKEAKKEGRLRYIGVQVGLSPGTPLLESIMRNEPIDFIGLHYAIDFRGAEQTFLPLAQERKIGVIAYYPFGGADTPCPGASGPPPSTSRSLFARVGDRPLPEWAVEFDAKTWAQFFLKYVVSHPAVTVARVGTTKAHHMLDDIGGGIGRLPNEETRKRMAAFIDALPPLAPPQGAPAPGIALSAAILDRYVGEYKSASGFTATFRRDGTTLFVKPGTNPEAPLAARSETRFQDPRGPFFEFQLDGQGKVTGAILEQGAQRTPLERK